MSSSDEDAELPEDDDDELLHHLSLLCANISLPLAEEAVLQVLALDEMASQC
jgi:hypothetical protein